MRRKRKAVTELVGTMLLLGMTLVAGFAVFAFVQSQAGVSELTYAQSVGGTVSYLQERFEVPLVSYTTSSITVYIFTNGQVPTQLAQIEVFGPSRSAMDVVYSASSVTVASPASCAGQTPASSQTESPMLGGGSGKLSVSVSSVSSVELTLPSCAGLGFVPGDVYFVELLGMYGNTATYHETM
jgi:flagellin-like protein